MTEHSELYLDDRRQMKAKVAGTIQKDESYYIGGAFVVFQVEDHLFRLPSYLFAKESEVFEGLFLVSEDESIAIEASSTSNPIVLPGESSQDFRNLVKALYPRPLALRLSLSSLEWLSVLKLATKWYFLRLRKMAINELERLHELSPVQRVSLGRQYRIASWLIEGLYELVNRTTTISDSEAIELDTDFSTTAYRVYRVREQKILREISSVKLEIERLFKDELDAIRVDQKGYD